MFSCWLEKLSYDLINNCESSPSSFNCTLFIFIDKHTNDYVGLFSTHMDHFILIHYMAKIRSFAQSMISPCKRFPYCVIPVENFSTALRATDFEEVGEIPQNCANDSCAKCMSKQENQNNLIFDLDDDWLIDEWVSSRKLPLVWMWTVIWKLLFAWGFLLEHSSPPPLTPLTWTAELTM